MSLRRRFLLPVLLVGALTILPAIELFPQALRNARPVVMTPSMGFQHLELAAALGAPGELLREALGTQLDGPPLVALTFDDGPYPLYTPALLDVLERRGARATFFVTGSAVRDQPELARQIAERGHELANHTFSHRREAQLGPGELAREILAAEREIRETTGFRTRLFRPAGGAYSPAMLATAGGLGYSTVRETVNTGDWWQREPGDLYRAALRGRVRGGIVLMHAGSYGMLEALPTVLDELDRKGLRCVTVSDLLRAQGRQARAALP